MQKVISTDKAPSAIGPYSQAIEVNGMVYTSGVIPVIPATGEIVEGGVEAQADQAFKNLCNLVEASGSKVENIVKTTVFIKIARKRASSWVGVLLGRRRANPKPPVILLLLSNCNTPSLSFRVSISI